MEGLRLFLPGLPRRSTRLRRFMVLLAMMVWTPLIKTYHRFCIVYNTSEPQLNKHVVCFVQFNIGVHTMNHYNIIGIDLAKRKFHIAAINHNREVVLKKSITR